FAPIGAVVTRNTPADIDGPNSACRPVIFSVNASVSGDFFFRPYHLKAMLFCVGAGGGFPFLAVRRHQPDRQPALIPHIGYAALRRATLQPAPQRVLPAEIRLPALQAAAAGGRACRVVR